MRWVTYDGGFGLRTGIVDGQTVRGLNPSVTLLSLLGDDGETLTAAAERARTGGRRHRGTRRPGSET